VSIILDNGLTNEGFASNFNWEIIPEDNRFGCMIVAHKKIQDPSQPKINV